MSGFKPGQSVRILINAGLCPMDDDTRFVASAEPGTIGQYIGRHPNRKLKGWHFVAVGELRAPLGPSQFEAA